jgi:hypothetical protein
MILADLIQWHMAQSDRFAGLAQGARHAELPRDVVRYSVDAQWHRDAANCILRADRGYELIPLERLAQLSTLNPQPSRV